MKKLLLLLAFLVTTVGLLSAENKADFNTMNGGKPQTNNYGSYTSDTGWKTSHCMLVNITDESGATNLAPTLNGKTSAVGTVTSPTLTNGVGTVSFDYTNHYSEKNGVKVKIEILQGESLVKFEELTNKSVTKDTKYTFTTSAFNVEGDFQIKVTNLSPSKSTSNADRVSIWNLTWTNYSGSSVTPTLGDIVATYGEENTPITKDDEISVKIGTTFTFSATNATNITVKRLSIEDPVVNENSNNITWTVNEPFTQDFVTVTATDGAETKTFEFLLAVTEPKPIGEYKKVSSMDELVTDKKYILVGATQNAKEVGIMGSNAGTYRNAHDMTDSNATTVHESYVITDEMDVCPFVIGEYNGAYALKLENGKYLAVESYKEGTSVDLMEAELGRTSGNYDLTKFTIEIEQGVATIKNGNLLSYNAGYDRFKSYKSQQSPVYLYKLVEPEAPTFKTIEEGATAVSLVSTKGDLHVWTLEYDATGTLVKDNGTPVTTAPVVAKAPADDDNTWTNKVAEQGVTHSVDFPAEGNYLKIRAKSVLNGIHSPEVVKSFDSKGGPVSGVEAVMTDDVNAPVEYFNLQGVRVNADAPGLYIRRQGSKVEKVTIR